MAGGGGGSSQRRPQAPSVPDPSSVAQAQTDLNVGAANTTRTMNMTGSTDQWGNTLVWVPDPNEPGGFRSVTTLGPGQQQIANNETTFGQNITNLGNEQLARVGASLATPIDLSPAAVENNLMGLGLNRYRPMWDQQEAALNTRLRNQGLVPGTQAYNAAYGLQTQRENDIINQLMLAGYSTGVDALTRMRSEPMQEMSQLESIAIPGTQFQSAPQVNVAPANFGSYAYNSADLQNQQYQQQMQYYMQQQQLKAQQQASLYGAIGGVAGTALGGWMGGLGHA